MEEIVQAVIPVMARSLERGAYDFSRLKLREGANPEVGGGGGGGGGGLSVTTHPLEDSAHIQCLLDLLLG